MEALRDNGFRGIYRKLPEDFSPEMMTDLQEVHLLYFQCSNSVQRRAFAAQPSVAVSSSDLVEEGKGFGQNTGQASSKTEKSRHSNLPASTSTSPGLEE
jgi:hypothetical protein